jgi:GNAT superfamily N-acetyltransferase
MNMYTVPEWRGQGIAAALLARAISFVKGRNVRCIRLHATQAGKLMYLKAGFALKASAMELTW